MLPTRPSPFLRFAFACLFISCARSADRFDLTTSIENGGTFEIRDADHPYRGFKLSVPEETFEQTSQWSFGVVSSPELPPLPEGYSLQGPALEIATDQARGAHLMALDVPVSRPSGERMVIAFFDPRRKVFEVLPTVGESETSIRVVTSHLRADLLIGRSQGAVGQPLRAATSGLIPLGGDNVQGLLLRLLMPPPSAPALGVVNFAALKWPVIDHGSIPFPSGHSLSISGLQALSTMHPSTPLSSQFGPLSTPGFYSDAAGLAAAIIGQREVSLTPFLEELQRELQTLAKRERDELVHRNVMGNLSVSGTALPMAMLEALGFSPTYVNAVAGSENELTLINPATPLATQFKRLEDGFGAISLLSVGDGAPMQVSEALPLPSFIYPFEKMTGLANSLREMVDDSSRRRVNNELSKRAGLFTFDVEVRRNPDSEWVPSDDSTVVLRENTAEVRLWSQYLGQFVFHLRSGAEVARSEGPPITAAQLSGLTNLLTPYTVSPVSFVGGKARQAGALAFKIAKSLLEVTPANHEIFPGATEVAFEAKVEHPPTEGFRLKWEWGDGKQSENLGLLNATHTYEVPGEYTVKVTLLTAKTGIVVAAGEAKVKEVRKPRWRIDTFVDQDKFYEDIDSEGGPDPFQRLLAAPNAGLILVTPGANGGSSLDLEVLPNGVWSAPVGNVPANAMNVPLGKAPSVQEQVGPYFAAWQTTQWSQSTEDLSKGTMSGQAIPGTISYTIDGVGTQQGPAGGVRTQATRSGLSMTGTFSVTIWFVDDKTGKLARADTYAFPFTATRI